MGFAVQFVYLFPGLGLLVDYGWKGGKKKRREQRSFERDEKLIRIGALAGSAAFLSHTWVDFNWQIPANQLYFVILSGPDELEGSGVAKSELPKALNVGCQLP